MNLIESIVSSDYLKSKELVEEKISSILSDRLMEMKKETANELFEWIEDEEETISEAGTHVKGINLGRERVLNYRIRHGKFKLRQVRSHVGHVGYAARHGDVGRQTPTEMQKRRLKARNSKYKKLIQRMRILQKRKISLNRRKALGLS